jgi:hypothetical protein
MNYPDLKLVIKEVCDQINCPFCRVKYFEDNIHVVGTTKNEGMFMAKCSKCCTNVVINVSVTRKSQIRAHERTWQPIIKQISFDEVLDMHNFLLSFEGDVYNLLRNP